MANEQPVATNCPNCHAVLTRGARRCPGCKLEVSQMGPFAAAKLAARRKGYGAVEIEGEKRVPWYKMFLRPAVIFPLMVVVLVGAYFARPAGAPAWTRLPGSPTDAAQQLLAHISTGTDEGYDAAYAIVAPSAKNPKDSDDIGKYRQLYHVMNLYLAAEFGADWITQTTLEPDNANPDLIVAHVGVETLHVRAKLETPAEKLNDGNHHYAIEGIDEFDIADAADLQKAAGIMGVVRGYAGAGAGNNLQTIISPMGSGRRHETAMQTKLRILPNLRDPRNAVRRTVLQAWPVRKDAVIRSRLTRIVNDGRYANDVQQTAQDVLNESVPEEDLIAAGVE